MLVGLPVGSLVSFWCFGSLLDWFLGDSGRAIVFSLISVGLTVWIWIAYRREIAMCVRVLLEARDTQDDPENPNS
jgi:hypothetical protein